MDNLTTQTTALPAKVEDLSRFVIIGREKLNALRAEIRAIQKCELAREVYEQKLEEQRMLSDLILDASVKIGEFTKTLPKSTGGRPEKTRGNVAPSFHSKEQTIEEMGFSKDQVKRFERMADHPEIVEQVKADAKAQNKPSTQTEVLRRIQQSEKVIDFAAKRDEHFEEERRRIDADSKAYTKFLDCVYAVLKYDDTDSELEAVSRAIFDLDSEVDAISRAIAKLTDIRAVLIRKGAKNGKVSGDFKRST